MENHVTKEQFLMEFFGSFGRDLGNPERWFTDNPTDIFLFVEECAQNKTPAFVSVQPEKDKAFPLGIEKVFFDFDLCRKSEALSLAETLQNPWLLEIHFHTLRHWKATVTYHQCKDPYYVQHLLGHKSIKSTEIYINIEHTLFEAGANDQFTVRIVEKPEEIKELLEAGFEYVCQKDTYIFLRKRK